MAFLNAYLRENGASGLQHTDTHQVWSIPIKAFNGIPIKRWKYNRPPDMERVAEIREHHLNAKRMDGILFLAEVDSTIVCYESNHRREALKGLDDMADVLVDIMFNATHEQIKKEFLRLNKAVSVPELYVLEETTDVKAEDLVACVRAFCTTYASLKVTTGRPQRPNFNESLLTDDFLNITRTHKISVTELARRMNALNERWATERDRSKLSEKVLAKCDKSNLWLFAWNGRLDPNDFA